MRFLFVLLLIGCTSSAPSPDQTSVEPPPPSGVRSAAPPTPKPRENITRELPNVAVVLGPGGGKAFAHAGVLQALLEARIPLAKVVGIEWGALIGASFAVHGQAHDVDWKLYKLEQVDLKPKSGLFTTKDHGVQILDPYLKENFGEGDFSSLKIPFACPSRSYWTGSLVMQKKGLVREALKRCLPFPPLFDVHGWLAAATHAREVVAQLRQEGFKLVIFVDVLGNVSPFQKDHPPEASTLFLWQDVQRLQAQASRDADEVIRVPTEGTPIDRFDQRKDLVQVGLQEGGKLSERLRAKYGF